MNKSFNQQTNHIELLIIFAWMAELFSPSEDLYAILNVSKRASEDEIKSQFKLLAKILHPDKTNNDQESEKLFLKVNFAYKVLSNPVQRKIFDDMGIEGILEYLKDVDEVSNATTKIRERNDNELQLSSFDEYGENLRDRVMGRMLLGKREKEMKLFGTQAYIQAKITDRKITEMQVSQSVSIPFAKKHKLSFTATAVIISLLQRNNASKDAINDLFFGQSKSQISKTHGVASVKLEHEYKASELTTVSTDFALSNSNDTIPLTTKIQRVLSPVLTASLSYSNDILDLSTSNAGVELELSRQIGHAKGDELEVYSTVGHGSKGGVSLGLRRNTTWQSKNTDNLVTNFVKSSAEVNASDYSSSLMFSFIRGYSYNSMIQGLSYASLTRGYFDDKSNFGSTNVLNQFLQKVIGFVKRFNLFYLPNLFDFFDSFHNIYSQREREPDVSKQFENTTTLYSLNSRLSLLGIDLEAGLDKKTFVEDVGFSFLFSLAKGIYLNLKFRRNQLFMVFPIQLISVSQLIHGYNTFTIISNSALSVTGIVRFLLLAKLVDLGLRPILEILSLEDENYWVSRENQLRRARNRALQQMNVMNKALESTKSEPKIKILEARYGTKMSERFPWYSMSEESLIDVPGYLHLLLNSSRSHRIGVLNYVELYEKHPKNIDVSKQIQFLCLKKTSLRISVRSKEELMGFYNPLKNRPELGVPYLYIKYSYDGRVFERTWEDQEPVLLPCTRAPEVSR